MSRVPAASRLASVFLFLAASRVVWTAFHYFQHGRQGRHRVETAWLILAALALATVTFFRRRSTSPAAPTDTTWPGIARVWLGLSVAGAFALYWGALRIGLLSDDYVLLNRSWSDIFAVGSWEYFRPLPLAAWRVLSPLGPTALHALNILLHGCNAWLVAHLAFRLGHGAATCAFCGVVFLTFPAAVEPVVWASGVFDVAMVTLALLYLHACILSRGIVWILAALCAALLTKETAVVLPAVALVLRSRVPIPWRILIASAAASAVYVAVRVAVGITIPPHEPAPLPYTIKEIIVRPFASLAVPWTGEELTAHPLVLGVAVTTAIAALVCLASLRTPSRGHPAVGPAVALIGVLPLLHVMFIGDDLEGSRYLYLPLVGWTLFGADLIGRIDRGRVPMYASAAAIAVGTVGAYGVQSHIGPWLDAARVRDGVLQSARDALARTGCETARFENVPQKVEGAFVFRNGLPEALRLPAVPSSDGRRQCSFRWSGDRFVEQ